jgi:hypothetical protein
VAAVSSTPVPASLASTRDVSLAAHRAVLWGLLVSKTVAGWGVQWDIQWHLRIGRDSFWIPPHVMTYAGVGVAVVLSFCLLAWTTWRAPRVAPPGLVSVLGIVGTRGVHIAAWGIALTVLAAPIDDLWHRLFGIDVTLWSPPHLLGIVGAATNTVGCLVIAREAYPPASAARVAALVWTGALIFGILHFAIQPTMQYAYLHGGVAFHGYAMLAPVLLPLGLIATARLSGHRWAPVATMILVVVTGVVGRQIAQVGFEILKPFSVIEREIAKDPRSPIAVSHAIAQKNGTEPGNSAARLPLVSLVAVLAIVAADARRRVVWATVAYALTLFVVMGARLATQPAFAPLVPGAGATTIAVLITLVVALVCGVVIRSITEVLANATPA